MPELIRYQVPEDNFKMRYTKVSDVEQWAKEHNVWISIGRGVAFFRDEQDLTHFLLRWS